MKTTFTALLSTLLLTLVSCVETTTISGVMPYTKAVSLLESSIAINSSNTKLRALFDATQMGVAEIKSGYDKKWEVPFSGSSIGEALAAEDEKAMEGYDKAVADLKQWQQTLQSTIAAGDYGRGSFKLSYQVVVQRDEVLKESEPIVFEYPTL